MALPISSNDMESIAAPPTNITASVVADSVSAMTGQRITSFILRYPRLIHSELMTHRDFSRNAASSRAIPVSKMIDSVLTDPARPEWWGAAQKGMQASIHLPHDEAEYCLDAWMLLRDLAVTTAREMLSQGLHKQIANRVLEPWCHITVLVTATNFHNFFSLRAHPDAQPEFQVLAYRALHQYLNVSTPTIVEEGDWHMPFGDKMPDGIDTPQRLKIATARSARTSYNTFDGEFTPEKDYEMHDNLARVGHWSPFEHSAQADASCARSGNFINGWRQYRSTFPGENRNNVNLQEVLATKPDWITV